MQIPVAPGLSLQTYTLDDIPSLALGLNDPVVYRNTLTMPHPYTEAHAEQFIRRTLEERSKSSLPTNFGLKADTGEVAGGIGLIIRPEPWFAHQAELGYWIAKRYRGRGLMTQTLKAFTAWVWDNYGFERLWAQVREGNEASMRALLSAGFQEEGRQRKALYKDEEFWDNRLYGMLRNA